MPAQPPTAPPRRKPNIKKEDISEPYDFVHLNHVGLDFNSEDVKKAIRHSSDSQLRQEHLYESVSRTETPILSATPPRDDLPPPLEFAPEYGSKPSTAAPPIVGRGSEPEIVEYANRPSQHLYMNVNSEKARPSRKKNPPPPPPPQAEKPRRERSEEPEVILRKPATPPPDAPPAEVSCPIQTSQRIDVAPPSVILERPGMLGEMRIGLDDPIPLQTGVPSKYRSPSMLTPREMAVDVPTPMRSPADEAEPADPAPSAPLAVKEAEEVPTAVALKPVLVKDKAVDIPTPPSKQNKPPRPAPPVINPVLVAAASSEKRPAPSPPDEPEAAAPKVIYNPYVPLSAARSSPQLKNVISELKVKQGGSGEAIKEEEGEAAAGEEEVKKSVEEDKNNNVEMIDEGKEVKVEQEVKIVKKESQKGADNVSKESVKKDSDKVKESSTSKDGSKEDKKVKEPAEAKVSKRDSKKENDRKEADRPKESSSKREKSKEGSKPSEHPKESSSSSKKPKEVKKEAPKDDSDHEYVAIDGLRRSSPADPRRPVAEQAKPQVQQVPTPPVPRPRKTVALSEESKREEEAPKVEDDGIDTGCSDEEDAVVLRL